MSSFLIVGNSNLCTSIWFSAREWSITKTRSCKDDEEIGSAAL